MTSEQVAQSSSENMRASCQKKLIRLVHYKESQIVLKTGQYEKIILQQMTASRSSVALNYLQTGLGILFTTFLETKTRLQINESLFGVLH